ncbi:MAG: ferritin family protein [Sarcina sp.]
MNLLGATKGTELEEMIDKLVTGEAMAAGMYFALSHIAREQGNEKVANVLAKIGTDEARHSGLYSVLNGKVNEDIFEILPMFLKEEQGAGPAIGGLADKAEELGMKDVAELIRGAANDETGHANALEAILAGRV